MCYNQFRKNDEKSLIKNDGYIRRLSKDGTYSAVEYYSKTK